MPAGVEATFTDAQTRSVVVHILLYPVQCFEYIPVLEAQLQAQVFCSVLKGLSKGLAVGLQRDIHLVDHDVLAWIIPSSKACLEVGNVSAVKVNIAGIPS